MKRKQFKDITEKMCAKGENDEEFLAIIQAYNDGGCEDDTLILKALDRLDAMLQEVVNGPAKTDK